MIAILLLAVVSTLFGAIGAIYLKKGTPAIFTVRGFLNKFLVLGVFFYGLGMLLFLVAYKSVPLSTVYPLVSLSYVWVLLFSWLFLKERLVWWRVIGIVFVIVGITLTQW